MYNFVLSKNHSSSSTSVGGYPHLDIRAPHARVHRVDMLLIDGTNEEGPCHKPQSVAFKGLPNFQVTTCHRNAYNQKHMFPNLKLARNKTPMLGPFGERDGSVKDLKGQTRTLQNKLGGKCPGAKMMNHPMQVALHCSTRRG